MSKEASSTSLFEEFPPSRTKGELVKCAWAEYIAECNRSVNATLSNITVHNTNIPDSHKLARKHQKFVHERRLLRQKNSSEGRRGLFAQQSVPGIQSWVQNICCIRTSVRTTVPFEKRLLLQEKKGSQSYQRKEGNLVKQSQFFTRIIERKGERQRTKVYINECYIHHYYLWHEDFLYDLTHEKDLDVRSEQKRRRYGFIPGIINADHSISEERCAVSEQAAPRLKNVNILEGGE